ncbi:metallophosphoesterase family protein [Falsihalocynthiibacter sp. SS001]|uniref:metallophosphoesterase family protein n=1 Tax=Falsihalocynthiibacter sp. SS001 TaxID=3349698 RepID=UPI0036D25C48
MRPKLPTLWAALAVWIASASIAFALEVAVISDTNGSYGSTKYSNRVSQAIERIIQIKPDLVIATGDLVAGQRKPLLSQAEVDAMWTSFHRTVSDPLAKAGIPLAVTPGNHDASAYSGFERERKIFAAQWSKRRPAVKFLDDKDYPFFYGFEKEGTLFVSYDATTLGPLSGDQMQRLKAMSKGYKSIVTFSHLPLWPFAQAREREIIGDTTLDALQREVGVSLHLSGHHHAYYPGWKDGVAYVSQACLGGGARKLIGTSGTSEHSFTMLSIDANGNYRVKALRAPNYTSEIDITTLPQSIKTPKATLKRLDLAN